MFSPIIDRSEIDAFFSHQSPRRHEGVVGRWATASMELSER
jgi:hypothetical protein